jgi:multiple sugar transport system ATP-binding protein
LKGELGRPMGKVVCEHVIKKFGEVVAVDDFNLEIENNEFVVIVGPSGCGKSTSLRMIAGLEQQTAGNIYIGDRLVNDLPPRDRNIAMVFQNYALYPHMNVYENMAFALKLKNTPPEAIEKKVVEAAEILSIGSLLKRKPKELSGGQRQRVALGRAIVREPAVFLMDEPLSNLDAKLRVQMRAELAKLHKRLNATTVYVTHDQTEAMTMAHRIVVMKDGIIQQIGDPHTIYDRPSNRFVAGFIGTPPMNFVSCRLEQDEADWRFAAEGLSVPVPAGWLDRLAAFAGQDVVLGIRPENVALTGPEGAPVQAMVDVVEPLGAETHLHVTAATQLLIVRAEPDCRQMMGDRIGLTFNMDKAHVFDSKSGVTVI